MAKKTKKQSGGEQLDLIDVLPAKAKPIIKEAKVLRKFQIARSSAQQKENDQKAKLLGLIESAEIPRLPDGKIKFSYDGVTIIITPKQESVSVKEEE